MSSPSQTIASSVGRLQRRSLRADAFLREVVKLADLDDAQLVVREEVIALKTRIAALEARIRELEARR